MKEAYFDPAMQQHKARMQQVYKCQRRRALFKKYLPLIASTLAASVMLVALFDQLLQIFEAMR